MKYLRVILGRTAAVAAASFVFSFSASALTITDEVFGYPLKFLTPSNPSYSKEFNILDDGYNPETMYVKSATAYFWFADDADSALEWVKVHLGNLLLLGPIEVNGNHSNPIGSYDMRSGSLSDTMVGDLQDGKIDYLVKVVKKDGKTGDTYLKGARLVVEVCEIPEETPPVPEGGATLVLLGLGLAGLAGVARRTSLMAN
jgi:hypothetical protein